MFGQLSWSFSFVFTNSTHFINPITIAIAMFSWKQKSFVEHKGRGMKKTLLNVK